jgi:hypothetical protein
MSLILDLKQYDNDKLCSIRDTKLKCNGTMTVGSADRHPTVSKDKAFELNKATAEALLAEWLRGQSNKYTDELLGVMANYCINFKDVGNFELLIGLIRGLLVEVSRLYVLRQ